MSKIDFKKEFKTLYNSSVKEAELVEVPPMNFLMIDGAGDPNTAQDFQDAVEALYSLAYTLKFMVKKGPTAIDYAVMPLEGLWWVDDMTQFSLEKKADWQWTLMIMQPEYVNEELFYHGLEQAQKKKNLPALVRIRLESFEEGLAAQIMHLGPYAAEGPTVEKLHKFINEKGYAFRGKHHEIYLSDPRKSAPEKMKTVLRQTIK